MASGLPDLVDCMRLAEAGVLVHRTYALSELPRMQDLLAQSEGQLHASFAFAKLPMGRAGAKVRIAAVPRLTCQRCLHGFGYRIEAGSDIEFRAAEEAAAEADSEREFVATKNGHVSLQDLAEEELLLALPIAPACDAPLACGHAPACVMGEESAGGAGDVRRPFSALHDLLKKT